MLVAGLFLVAGLASAGPGNAEKVTERFYDKHDRVYLEKGTQGDDLSFERWFLLAPHKDNAKPDHAGGGKPGGGGGGGGGSDPGTDCESDNFRHTGFHWTSPYSATASSYANLLDQAGQAWEDALGTEIFGGITSGSQATAGVQDYINQMDWTSLGASSTIAVTTTWYYTSSGEAVESDAQYNTYYNWATNGDPNAMDVLHIATHEIGHTFGMDHPSGPAHKIGCLTMYAYASEGSTHGRTLGDGDIIGIQALYA